MQLNDPTVGIKAQALSERQREVLRFIREYILEHKHPPSTRDISFGVGIRSTSNVVYHINRLIENGYLGKQPGTSRSLVVLAAGYEQINHFGEAPVQDRDAEIAALRAEVKRLRQWCRQLERERVWEREQVLIAQAG